MKLYDKFFETYVERSIYQSISTNKFDGSVFDCWFSSTLPNWWNDDQTDARKSKILNYQGTPEVLVGVLDSVI